MKKWEYKRISRDVDLIELNDLGREGWELITVIQTAGANHDSNFFRHIFKRPINWRG